MPTFPTGFEWGTATASYQIEGAVAADGRAESIWDRFSHTAGNTTHGDTGDIACDHYRRFEEDLDLLADLGVGAYRFSIAWPRVLPDGVGAVNQSGLDFYRRLCEGLRARGIEPVATLYHWDLPTALQDRGGWGNRDVAGWFTRYTEVTYQALGGLVARWITLNEPSVVMLVGHLHGRHAPGLRDEALSLAVGHHLLLAHGDAARLLKERGAQQVGITVNLAPVAPATADPADEQAAALADGLRNRLFLDPPLRGRYPDGLRESLRRVSDFGFVHDGDLERIAAPLDFLGVNYYEPTTVTADLGHPHVTGDLRMPDVDLGVVRDPRAPRTAMGWDIVPGGLSETLVGLSREYPGLPLYVTENGAAFPDYVDPEGAVEDEERIAYLDGHLRAAADAIAAGADLRGYYVWSLLDNFEWAEGYSRRFGLVFVDFGTQRRIPKASFAWYRGVVRRNGLEG
jgi:beta-glucosidase